MQTKTLSERIEELEASDKEILIEIADLVAVIDELQELNAISYDANARLKKENEALLAKNKELEEELQERKAYIVANPCAQCGGRINAMKCDAWAKKAKELEEKLKNNLEETEEVQIQKDDFAKEGFDKTVQTLWYSCQRCDKKFKIKKIGGEVT